MVLTIVKPTKNNLTIHLPDNLIGKMVEVIAFALDEEGTPMNKGLSKKEKVSRLQKELSAFSFNSGGYKFDRDEANDYVSSY